MVQVIYRQKNKAKTGWDRSIVSAEGIKLDSVNFVNPICDSRVKLEPITTKLFLLDYLKISFPMNTTELTAQFIIDSIPQDILPDVYAVEYVAVFADPWTASIFFEDVKNKNYVIFVALLTEKDTGKDLPPLKLTNDKPIGISDDDWDRVVREFYLNK